MNVVLYTDDMEPITVVDIPMWGIEMLRERQVFRIEVPTSVRTAFGPVYGDRIYSDTRIVSIWAEPIMRHKRIHWLMFTRDEEMALALKSEPLPGQRKEMQEEYRRGVADGIIKALQLMLGSER